MSNVKTYYKSKSGENLIMSLAPNFRIKEFACNDGTDKILIDNDFILPLQYLRNKLGTVIINSAYRTVTYNKKVGGASASMHLKGQATDIRVSGKSVMDIANLAYAIGYRRILVYSDFVHLDTKDSTYYHNMVTNTEQKFSKVDIPYSGTLLKAGSKSVDVGIVQFKLKNNGYAVGNVDGIFGTNTANAVKKFQKAKGLSVDGIVGNLTWNALFN